VAGKRTYKVTLTDEERDLLRTMLSSGKAAARKLNHARLLLYADESTDGLRRTDQEIAATLGIGARTVERVRQRFVEEGLDSALVPRPRPRGAYKVDQHVEAQILAIAKSDPPSGRKRGVTGGKLRSGARELAKSFPHRTEKDRIASSYSAETLGQRKGRCQGLSVWSG
jgi:transposase